MIFKKKKQSRIKTTLGNELALLATTGFGDESSNAGRALNRAWLEERETAKN